MLAIAMEVWPWMSRFGVMEESEKERERDIEISKIERKV